MTPQQENKVIKDIPEGFKELSYLSLEERNWLQEFKELSSFDLKVLVKCFERCQSLSIMKGFQSLDEKIFIPKLGVFYIKEAKLDLARLTGKDPCKLDPKEHKDIIDEVRRLYLERAKNHSKSNLNKTLNIHVTRTDT